MGPCRRRLEFVDIVMCGYFATMSGLVIMGPFILCIHIPL